MKVALVVIDMQTAYSRADAYATNFHAILARDAIADDTPAFHDVSLEQLEKDYRQEVLACSEIRTRLHAAHRE